ncbi:MAG: triple tyrosine motif-containing protein [Bacteroidales bacterium]|nr:triple tyrosine motif-containing protein [Bacteroidales bacterium]
MAKFCITKITLTAFLGVFSFCLDAFPIKKLGLPLINNFPISAYNASTQNWSITQNKKGFIYVGNNDGLLEFDGENWQLYPVPNKSIIRSVMAVGDTIFVGAFEQLGYFAPDSAGKLRYNSLIALLPEKFSSFDEVWKIYKIHDKIIFQTFKYLFVFENNNFSVIEPPSTFSYSYIVEDQIYIVDWRVGLMQVSDNQLLLLSNDPVFLRNEVRCILKYDEKHILIGTINEGLFLFDGQKLSPWAAPANKQLIKSVLFSGIRLENGSFAFGSVHNGLYLTDKSGEVLQELNRYTGLQNNTILSLFEDRNNNLWLGLDNGIDYIEINSPLSVFNYIYHLESVYTSIVHRGLLYVGTNQGLFYTEMETFVNNIKDRGDFRLIPGTEGQVWCLQEFDGFLLCGHNFGCFQVLGKQAKKIAGDHGFWTFIEHNSKCDTLIAGTYNGLYKLVKAKNTWKSLGKILGFDESSRIIVQDKQNYIWISHGYRGVYKVKPSMNLDEIEEVVLYAQKDGLPEVLPYNVHKINRDLIFATKYGIYEFDELRNLFFGSEKYNKIFGQGQAISTLHPDAAGNTWYFAFGRMGFFRMLEDGSYANITSPFNRINNMLIESFENVYFYDNRNVFIGSQVGLFHYDPNIKKDFQTCEPVYFREVIFTGDKSSRSFFNREVNGSDNKSAAEQIPYHMNSVSFRYACPTFESHENTRYSYRLQGFDQSWSPWETGNFKEYTNLHEGAYVFEVKARNVHNTESAVNSFSFAINPPWFRTKVAYILYILLLLLIIVGNILYLKRRIRKARLREKEKHERILAEQEMAFREKAILSEKEIIHLRNETLQGEVRHKNKELANSTLHLIHKNKILNAIKYQLNASSDKTIPQTKKNELDQIIKKINKELKNEKFQEIFDNYFDEVHQDFIARLKENYSDLSPKELRLCAYLKMNLSTKEIAPLMNISIRGVEIGRYRLRKKLGLDHEANLIHYLLSF